MNVEPLWSALKVFLAVNLGLAVAALLTWVERKQSAVLQDRIGANRADIRAFGRWDCSTSPRTRSR